MDSRSVSLRRVGRNRYLGLKDLAAVLQLVKAAGCHRGTNVQPLHDNQSTIRNTGRDVLHVGYFVGRVDDVDKGNLSVVLNSRRRNQRHALERVQQQARIYELIGKQSVVFVG